MNTMLRRQTIPLMLLAAVLAVMAVPAAADDLKDARAALQSGQYDQAITLFEKAAKDGYAEGRAGVGEVWLKRRQYAKALDAFQQAQKMEPSLAAAYYGQGEVLRRQGKCEQALPLLRKATELDKKYPDAQMSFGDCLIQTRQHEQAVAALSAGLKWGNKWRPRFLVALGNAELARDSLRDAGIYYTQARQEAPDDPTTLRALGDFYVKRGTFELAVPEYQNALSKDTSDVELRFALGRALFFAERYNEALQSYQEVVGRDPEFGPAQLALGDLLYRSGAADRKRYAEAVGPLEVYVKLAPEDPKGWSVYGRTLAQVGRKDEAFDALAKAEKLGDKSKELYTARARLNIDRKQYDAALADYERGRPEPEDELRIVQLYVIKGETTRAESLYTAIIQRDSTSTTAKFALSELAKMRFRAKDYDGAVGQFRRIIQLDPKNDEAYYYTGLSYKELKKYPEALDALRTAAGLAEGKLDRQFWYGIMLAQVDSTEAATRVFARVADLDSSGSTNKNTAIALKQLGYYALLKKTYTEAIRRLSRSTMINPQDVQAWVWLAQAYHNSGEKPKACEAYARALALEPNQPDAVKGRKALGC